VKPWARLAAWGLLAGGLLAPAGRAQEEGRPVVFTSGPGQFEVIGPDVIATRATVELARQAWRSLGDTLDLPPGFGRAISVRLVPEARWEGAAAFNVVVEPGGTVSLWVAWHENLPAWVLRRALVQALLMRVAVDRHGVQPGLQVPLWLEHGAVALWQIRANPALLDEWQARAADLPWPDLAELWAWERHEAADEARERAALWCLLWLREEGRAAPGTWARWRDAVLRGEGEAAALARLFPAWGEPAAVERRWRVGGWRVATRSTLAGWSAAESRLRLWALWRVVLTDGSGRERVVEDEEWWEGRDDEVLRAEVAWRRARLGAELPWVHAFYHNVALSAGRVWEAWERGDEAVWREARAQLTADILSARELEEVAREALDALSREGMEDF
jgi:hypothetical protein